MVTLWTGFHVAQWPSGNGADLGNISLKGNKMEKSSLIVPRLFLATILLSLVGAYVASHHLPNIWHLLDFVAFFAVLAAPVPGANNHPN